MPTGECGRCGKDKELTSYGPRGWVCHECAEDSFEVEGKVEKAIREIDQSDHVFIEAD